MSISDPIFVPAFLEPTRPPGRDVLRARSRVPRHGIDLDDLRRVLRELGRVDDLPALGLAGPLLVAAGDDDLANTLIGRDALRMALDLLNHVPRVAAATLLTFAALQGVTDDPRTEEEPGRILHEHRLPGDALSAEQERHRIFPYFGAIDSTPQWINLLVAYTARAGDAILDAPIVDRQGRQVIMFERLLTALGWLFARLDDPSGGGYLCVRRDSPTGATNQVWDDSPESYHHADGTLFGADEPFAPVAAQGYVYDALIGAAEIVARRNAPAALRCPLASELRARAGDLRARVLRDFRQADLSTFALALTFDGPGDFAAGPSSRVRPARVVSSSAGHLLASRLLDGSDVAWLRERLIRRLFEPDMLAGAGLRTRSSDAARFLPGSYHNGATWPMDTGVIADGLRRHGHRALANDLDSRILAGCAAIGGFPAYFRGDEDRRIAVNVATIDELVDGALHRLEEPPQADRGWTATRVWRIVSAYA